MLGIIASVLLIAAAGGAGVAVGDTSPFNEIFNSSPTQAAAFTASTQSSTTTLPPTTTTTAPPVALPPVTVPEGMARGASGPEVLAYEQRLADLRYDPGKLDGVFDGATVYAVQAFQKVQGMDRNGRITDDVRMKMEPSAFPQALVPYGGANRVEIDLARQVLFLYKDNALRLISTISTGNGRRYCVDGSSARAMTPGGTFAFTWRWNGWRTSRLGRLYNPVYFNGGIAIHGSLSVPTQPASHGCVRIPMHIAKYFPSLVTQGDGVHVLFGESAPVPFNEQAPAEIIRTKPPVAPTTTLPVPAPTTPTVPVTEPTVPVTEPTLPSTEPTLRYSAQRSPSP